MVLLINMTISVTLLAVVVLVLRILFKNKIPGKLIYALWAILALRIVLPVMPESCMSVYNYLPTLVVREESIYRLQSLLPETTDSKATYELVGGNTEYAKVKYIYGQHKQDYILLHHDVINKILFIWVGVATMFFLYFNIGILLFNKRKKRFELCEDEEILHILEEMQAITKVNQKIKLYYFSGTPFVKGFFRPVIFIPKIYDKKELEYVLLHELVHIRHKDYLIDYVSMTLICLNWFNPVVWYAFIQLKKDAEIYCDETVVQLRGSSKDYARVLVKASYEGISYKPLASFIGNNASDLKYRVTKLTINRQINIKRAVMFTVCIILCFATFFTNELSISSKDKDMGRVPHLFRENIERTVLRYYDKGYKADVLYLCEDQENIYVYAQVKDANDIVSGKCFLMMPITIKKDYQVEKGTYYVDTFQEINSDSDRVICSCHGKQFICGSFDQSEMEIEAKRYRIPQQRERYCIYQLSES